MHGGRGSGAPKGNSNALKHGTYTGPMLARARYVRIVIRTAQALMGEIERDEGGY
jgi:glucans biosynthesis protein